MATYINSDGLPWDFGTDEAELGNAAGFRTNGKFREVEIVVNWEDLPAVADGSVILNDKVVIPAGAVIAKVEKMPDSEAFDSSGDSMTLNIGLIDADDRSSNANVDAIVKAITQSELNAGYGENDSGWVGDGLDVALSQSKLLTWEVDSQAATAGRVTFVVSWFMPKDEEDTLVYTKS